VFSAIEATVHTPINAMVPAAIQASVRTACKASVAAASESGIIWRISCFVVLPNVERRRGRMIEIAVFVRTEQRDDRPRVKAFGERQLERDAV